jgi:hypothetical protein
MPEGAGTKEPAAAANAIQRTARLVRGIDGNRMATRNIETAAKLSAPCAAAVLEVTAPHGSSGPPLKKSAALSAWATTSVPIAKNK